MKTVKTVKTVEKLISVCSWLVLMVFLIDMGPVLPKALAKDLDLELIKVIQIACTAPNTPPGCLNTWATSGPNQVSHDVESFDPSTQTIYVADRVNKGATTIDTTTNTYIGTIPFPTNFPGAVGACTGSCPSGMLVAPDLHKLVMTDRGSRIAIINLRTGAAEAVLTATVGGTALAGTDELDYDPLNHRAYVANTGSDTDTRFFLTVVDLVNDTIVDYIALKILSGPHAGDTSSPEQPRFNPVDGFIYQNMPDLDEVWKIDPTQSGGLGTSNAPIAARLTAHATGKICQPHGIDIDPVTNRALLGCSNAGTTSFPQVLIDLSTGNIVTTFDKAPVGGTDIEYFNNNLRRWYTASSNDFDSSSGCPSDGAGHFPVLGVFAAPGKFVEADCTATNAHGMGVDPIHNNVYVGARNTLTNTFPPNQAGVMVFHDPSKLAQTLEAGEETQANVNPLSGFRAKAKVRGESTHVSATVDELPFGATSALLNITTTVGNEVVNCALTGPDEATCTGTLHGDPLLGGEVILAADGTPVAKGRITLRHGEH